MSTSTRIKRGGFAGDLRTGQVVKVIEMGGQEAMVRPAYKSDGYWVDKNQLAPVEDPHAWTGKTFFLFLVALAMAVGSSYGQWTDLHRHGISGWDATVYTLPGGLLVFALLTLWFKVSRP
jgi:hypothetical protein